MSIEIVVPQVGEAISAARLTQWHKKEGDSVRKGEPLFSLDTDKAILDVEAFSDGILEKILVSQDSDVQPGMTVALLRGKGDHREPDAILIAPTADKPTDDPNPSKPVRTTASRGDRSLAISPKARRLAMELGVDLAGLAQGSAGKMISEADIRLLAADGARTKTPTPKT
jgi:pyruvate dehydrogenase E2 component (dihydrolipoamide acetyltransferase)